MENYEILYKIGSGSFANVYLAKYIHTDTLYALKVIKKTDITSSYEKKLNNEINILKKVNHPNIIKLYDVIETHDALNIILEYVSGGDLYELIIKDYKKIKINDKKKIFNQLVKAVEYLHENNISHCDLKPENILIDENNNVKLIDFNLAYEFIPNEPYKIRCGSLEYAAPEVILGKPHYPCPSDTWSLGVILFILIYGEFPFQQTSGASTYSLYMKIAQAQFHFPNLDVDKLVLRNTQQQSQVNSIMIGHSNSISSSKVLLNKTKNPSTETLLQENKSAYFIDNNENPNQSSTETLIYYNQNELQENFSSSFQMDFERENNICLSDIGNSNEFISLKNMAVDDSYYLDSPPIIIRGNSIKRRESVKKVNSLNGPNSLESIREYNKKLILEDINQSNSLIKSILIPTPKYRATIQDILNHPWMKNYLNI